MNSAVNAGLAAGLMPKKKLNLAEWMERFMRLSAESSAEPGPFRFGDAAYQRGIAEAVSDPAVNEIDFMSSSQVGKSTILRGVIGYYAEHQPSPMLVVLPTEKVAGAFAADFVEPMIRDTPVLKALFASKDGRTQQTLKKSYPGGTMTLVGANVPSSLAMRPIRVVLGDEVDRWNKSSGKEGSPIALATARTKTYGSTRKLIWVSTPVHKETSTISELFEASDKRFFNVVCPDCQEEQALTWDRVIYTKGKEDQAGYSCKSCGVLWSEGKKRRLVAHGRWIATEAFTGKAGFHLSELYSPWSSMAAMAKACEESKGQPGLEQTFYNTMLGLPWSGDLTSTAQVATLLERREKLSRTAMPARASLATAGVDVQRDRIEVAVIAWGAGEECWILDHQKLYGDTSGPRVWEDLNAFLQRSYPHPLGQRVPIEVVAIDSGFMTQAVYDFSAKAQSIGRAWYAVKGVAGPRPIWLRSKMRFKDNTKLFLIGTDDAKQNTYARYQVETHGPGFVHIPDWLDEAVIEQMASEWCRVEYSPHGFSTLVWEKKAGARNEMLDLMCYNLAANRSLNLDLDYRLRQWAMATVPKLDAAEIGRAYAKGR
jgi:phage terminase large subunit GpA-like protein